MKTKVLTLVTVLILIITSVNAQKVKNLGEIEKLNLTGGFVYSKARTRKINLWKLMQTIT